MTRSVGFVLEQPQDVFVALGFTRLLREAGCGEVRAVVADDRIARSHQTSLREFDRVDRLGWCGLPRVRTAPVEVPRILRYRRRASALRFTPDDTLVAFSFREFSLNVLIRALRTRPRLVAVRKCDHASELLLTRRRPAASAYRNAWNLALGASTQRYRWLPTSDRVAAGTFTRSPYAATWCLAAPGLVDPTRAQAPFPFALLRPPPAGGRRTIVWLGERYPLAERLDDAAIASVVPGVVAALRATFPEHRLVFKPRDPVERTPFDLGPFELLDTDEPLESMLARDPSVEAVVSFKSSGSFVAGLYGCLGIALYPLLPFEPDFRETLDRYFEPYAGIVTIATSVEDVGAARPPVAAAPAAVREAARPFLAALLEPSG